MYLVNFTFIMKCIYRYSIMCNLDFPTWLIWCWQEDQSFSGPKSLIPTMFLRFLPNGGEWSIISQNTQDNDARGMKLNPEYDY